MTVMNLALASARHLRLEYQPMRLTFCARFLLFHDDVMLPQSFGPVGRSRLTTPFCCAGTRPGNHGDGSCDLTCVGICPSGCRALWKVSCILILGLGELLYVACTGSEQSPESKTSINVEVELLRA